MREEAGRYVEEEGMNEILSNDEDNLDLSTPGRPSPEAISYNTGVEGQVNN